jgi:hypothetical protein
MKYVLLLWENEAQWSSVSEEEMRAAVAEHAAFGQFLRDRGIAFSGEAIGPSATAKTLRPPRPDATPEELVLSDGPFVGLEEHLAGYYLIEAADMDEALEIARRCPIGSATEVRPVWGAP